MHTSTVRGGGAFVVVVALNLSVLFKVERPRCPGHLVYTGTGTEYNVRKPRGASDAWGLLSVHVHNCRTMAGA